MGSRQDPRSALVGLRCAFNLLRILLLHVSYGEIAPYTLSYDCLEVLGNIFQYSILLHTNAVASYTHCISSSPASKEIFTSACSLAWHYSQAHCPYADLRSILSTLLLQLDFLTFIQEYGGLGEPLQPSKEAAKEEGRQACHFCSIAAG